jgi:peptidoglycan/LPS O-acetylase OafA/YrhL
MPEPAVPDRTHDTALDGLRAVAALLVFFYHARVDLKQPPLVVLGSTGVHVFFALSGYLMFGPFARALWDGRPLPSLTRYAIRRFFRIYPGYFVALAGYCAIEVFHYDNPPALGNVVTHALLVFNLVGRHPFFSINPVLWSLAVEAQFYILLPVFCVACARMAPRSPRAAAILVPLLFLIVGLASRAVEFEWLPMVGQDEPRFGTVLSFLDLFAWGMLVSLAEVSGWRPRRIRRWLPAVGLVIYFAANSWSVQETAKGWFFGRTIAYTLVYPSAICAAAGMFVWALRLRTPGERTPLQARPLVWIGKVSYSLYLSHFAVLLFVWQVMPVHPPTLAWDFLYACVGLAPALLVAGIFYALVEAPCMRLGGSVVARLSSFRGASAAGARGP